MRKLSLLVFILFPLLSIAQRELYIHPFEDYGNCTTGFINGKGDTIWQAEFEQVYHLVADPAFYEANYWRVTYLGKMGLLSPSGKLLLPFEFTQLELTYQKDQLIAEKNGKKGIIRTDGSIVIPFEIDSILHPYQFPLEFIQNGKHGIIGIENTIIVPPLYNYIETESFSPDYRDETNDLVFYKLHNDQKFGLADESGKTYFTDSPYWFSFANNPANPTTPFLLIYNEGKGSGLATLSNEIILEPIYSNLSLFSLPGQQDQLTCYALVEDSDRKMQVIDLTTRKQSSRYDLILIGSHGLIYYKGKKQGVLNAQLEEFPVRSDYDLRFYSNQIYDYGEDGHFSYPLPFIPGSPKDAVLILADSDEKKGQYSTDRGYGLINIETKATVKPDFFSIVPKTWSDEHYYYAFTSLPEDVDTGAFVIFRSDLSIAANYRYKLSQFSNFNRFFSKWEPMDSAYLFMNQDQKVGAIYPDGQIAIPFEYDKLKEVDLNINDASQLPYLYASKGLNNGIIDWKGNELIPITHPVLKRLPTGYYIAGDTGNMRLYSPAFEIILDSCQFMANLSSDGLIGYKNPMIPEDETFASAIFVVKNDTAYALYQDGLRPINTANFRNHSIDFYWIIGNQLLLEKTGKCLLYKPTIGRLTDQLYKFNSGENLSLFHVDKGVTITLKNATASRSNDRYVHILQRPNHEGIASLETGEWVLLPDAYTKIVIDEKKYNKQQEDNFWVIQQEDAQKYSGMWSYYLSAAKTAIPRKFDIPLFQRSGGFIIARSEQKYGLLDTSYADVLPFIYKRVVYSNGIFFVKSSDDLWSAWTPEKGLIPLNCKEVSFSAFSNGRLIFNGEKVGVLSTNLEIIQPFVYPKELLDSVSLFRLLGNFVNDRNYFNWQRSLVAEETRLARLMNNQTIIDMSRVYSTQHQMTEPLFQQQNSYKLSPRFVDPVHEFRSEDRTILHVSERCCSYRRNCRRLSLNESMVNSRMKTLSEVDDDVTYITVVLENDQLRQAQLSDFFTAGTDYNSILDYRLTTEINQKQLFGIQCLNLPAILLEYKANFRLENNGITFSMRNGSKPIHIPVKEFKSYLKPL